MRHVSRGPLEYFFVTLFLDSSYPHKYGCQNRQV